MCGRRPGVTLENGRWFREQWASGGEVICLRFEEGHHFFEN